MTKLPRDRPTENRIGDRIAEARRAAGLTRTDLADRVGLRLWHIEGFETAGSIPPAKLGEIAAATGRPLSWFTDEAPEDAEVSGTLLQAAWRPLEDGDARPEERTLDVLEATSKLIADLSRPLVELEDELATTGDRGLRQTHEPGSEPPCDGEDSGILSTPAELEGESDRARSSAERHRLLDDLMQRTRSVLSSR